MSDPSLPSNPDNPQRDPDGPADLVPDDPAPHGSIPIARPAGASAPATLTTPPSPSLSAKPILELADDNCPRCGAAMEPDAVVCFKCGYDLKANVVHNPTVGVAHTPEGETNPDGTPIKDFVKPGRGQPQLLLYTGAILLLAAMIASGVFAPHTRTGPSVWLVIGNVVLTAYLVLLHTGTGIAAVAAAAKLSEERFSRIELVTTRMLVAVAAFQLLNNIHWPIAWSFVAETLRWALAAAGYWLVIKLLFNRDRLTTSLIALAHFGLWIIMWLGMILAAWVQAAGVAASITTAP